MHQKTIGKKIIALLQSLGKIKEIKNFYLAGGTSLALQIGHRKSIDLDFFSAKKFNNTILKSELQNIGKIEIVTDEPDTLNLMINEVKVSFFYYPYKLIFPKIKFDNILLADWRDIATMKLEAIGGRGSKKDFIDLYFLCENNSLSQIFTWYKEKFIKIKYNELHLLKSLTYFEDAEKEPMPKMLKDISWSNVKKELIKKVKEMI